MEFNANNDSKIKNRLLKQGACFLPSIDVNVLTIARIRIGHTSLTRSHIIGEEPCDVRDIRQPYNAHSKTYNTEMYKIHYTMYSFEHVRSDRRGRQTITKIKLLTERKIKNILRIIFIKYLRQIGFKRYIHY